MKLEDILGFLRDYPQTVKIMEVCGTHTGSIIKNSIREIISPTIKLVSGPGCPVCVTPEAFIDALVEKSFQPNTCVLSFGDLMRVPGGELSFSQAKAKGGCFHMIYSPLEAVELARKNPDICYIVAAVGFETTIPIYAVLLEQLISQNITNVRLCTALRTMPAALEFLCENRAADAYLCPGHVSSIIGSEAYEPLLEQYKKPFVIAGFEAEHILAALYRILKQLDNNIPKVENLYKNAVSSVGNLTATQLIQRYFTPCDGLWRGIGTIESSALRIREEYSDFAVSYEEYTSESTEPPCRCGDVLLGRISPRECHLFGSACTPERPVGACMVSGEGACGIWYGEESGR